MSRKEDDIRRQNRDKTDFSDKQFAKEAIAGIFAEISAAEDEERMAKISKKDKELALAFWDEFKMEELKWKWGALVSLASTLYFQPAPFTGHYWEFAVLYISFAFLMFAFLNVEYNEMSYIRKMMPSARTKTKFETERATVVTFGFLTEINYKKLTILYSILLTISLGLSNSDTFYQGVFNGVLMIIYTVIIFGFSIFTTKIKG